MVAGISAAGALLQYVSETQKTACSHIEKLIPVDLEDILIQLNDYLSGPFNEMHDPVKDTDCLNIRDEILAVINRLRYLITLK